MKDSVDYKAGELEGIAEAFVAHVRATYRRCRVERTVNCWFVRVHEYGAVLFVPYTIDGIENEHSHRL